MLNGTFQACSGGSFEQVEGSLSHDLDHMQHSSNFIAQFQFAFNLTGVYTMHAVWNQQLFLQPSSDVAVHPAHAYAATSYVYGSLFTSQVYENHDYSVSLRTEDQYGNLCDCATDDANPKVVIVSSSFQQTLLPLCDSMTGIWNTNVTISEAGSYNLSVMVQDSVVSNGSQLLNVLPYQQPLSTGSITLIAISTALFVVLLIVVTVILLVFVRRWLLLRKRRMLTGLLVEELSSGLRPTVQQVCCCLLCIESNACMWCALIHLNGRRRTQGMIQDIDHLFRYRFSQTSTFR